MPLIRATCQGPQPLEEYYESHLATEQREEAQAMLDLLPGLREVVGKRAVWGLTSHLTLCLLNSDDWESGWLVKIKAWQGGYWYIDYQMSRDVAPWPDARVWGGTHELSEALLMVRSAMERTGAW